MLTPFANYCFCLALSVLLVSCGGGRKQPQVATAPVDANASPATQLTGTFDLVAMAGQPATFLKFLPGELEVPRLELDGKAMEVVGTDGCNRLFGEIASLTSDSLRFGQLGGTVMMCGSMAVPDSFNLAIRESQIYTLTGNRLELIGTNGEVLATLWRR